jgi:hypothetical protein
MNGQSGSLFRYRWTLAEPNPKALLAPKKAPKVTTIAQSCYDKDKAVPYAFGRREDTRRFDEGVSDQ